MLVLDDRGVHLRIGHDDVRAVIGTDNRVAEGDLLDRAADVIGRQSDQIADPKRLIDRQEKPGDEISEGLLGRNAVDQGKHGGRTEQRIHDRAHRDDVAQDQKCHENIDHGIDKAADKAEGRIRRRGAAPFRRLLQGSDDHVFEQGKNDDDHCRFNDKDRKSPFKDSVAEFQKTVSFHS